MDSTKLFALGEREEIHNELKIHQNSSTFYQDANYHNQIVNELCSFMCKEFAKKQTKHINCHGTPGLKPHQYRFCRKSLFTNVSV